jgi:hypothetical protein
MDLTTLLAKFKQSPPGTDAYQALKDACLDLIKSDPNNAASYFLISRFARSYVLLQEEEAVTFEIAERAKKQMVDYLTRIHSANEHGSAENRLSSLNSIVLDYLQSERIF